MAALPKALVTGGSGALGRAVCSALVGAGYEVHASTTSAKHGLGEAAGLEEVRVHVADLTDEDDVAGMFEEVGLPLAALVATVGGFAGGPLAEIAAADIDQLTALNLKTTVLTLKGAYPYLKANPGGAGVVLVAARSAVQGGPNAALYSATKAAVVNFALSASREWKRDAISVNAILPSTMDTPANRRSMPDADFSLWPKVEEVAQVAAFLVSEKARIISGGAIPVYGRA